MKTLFTSLLLLICFSISAQRAEWLRASIVAPVGNWTVTRNLIAVDNNKNSITCRDADSFIVDNDTVYSYGNFDIAIIKTDSLGNLVWTKDVGTTSADAPEDICTDSQGNIYISVTLDGTTTTTDDTTYNTPAGIFHQIIKLAPDGSFIRSITTQSNTIITTNGTNVYAANAQYVIKMDSAFNQIWIRNFGLNTIGFNVGSSRNKISSHGHYLAFSADETWSNSAGLPVIDTVTIPFGVSTNFDQSCAVLMDTSGSAYWARVTDSLNIGTESSGGAYTDAAGNVYHAVYCDQDFVLGNDTMHLNGGFTVAGIIKYDLSGNVQWTQPIHNTGHMNLKNIVGSSIGNVLVEGNHDGVVQAGTYSSLSQNSGSFVVGYTPSGSISFAKFHSSAPNSGTVEGLAIHPSGDFWISGRPISTTSWDCYNIPSVTIITTPSYWGRFTMQPVITPQANFSYSANGNIYSFTNLSQNADSIKWDFGDATFSNLPNPVHTFANGQNYTIVLTAYYGICIDTDTLNIIGVGISESQSPQLFSLYPSPANDNVILHAGVAVNGLHLRLTDISGRIVMEEEWTKTGNEWVLTTHDFLNGIYFLNLNTSKTRRVLRMVVQH